MTAPLDKLGAPPTRLKRSQASLVGAIACGFGVAILTGVGDVYCVGADLKRFISVVTEQADKLAAGGARVTVFPNHIGERMADELGANAGLLVELLFKRQQAEHEIDGRAYAAHAPLAPRPHLWTHVLHGTKPRSSQIACQPKIEFRRIDPDEHIRTLRQQSLAQISAHLQ